VTPTNPRPCQLKGENGQNVPAEYTRTDAAAIPADWRAAQIREICTLINGRGFKPHEWRNSGMPIIRIQNLNGSDDFNYYDGAFDPKILVHEGALLFAWSGSRGSSFGPHVWHGSPALLNYHTWKILPHDTQADATFLFHALRYLTAYIEATAHGASALVHTQKWEMEGFQLALPPLSEQRAIAKALSDVDALLGTLEALIAKKRAINQAVTQQLLTGKTRLPGFSGKWEMRRLCDIVNTPITDGPHLTPAFLSDGIPFLSVNNLIDNKLDFGSLRFISRADHEEFSRKCMPQRGDILFGKAASVGQVALIDTDAELNIWSPLALIRVGPKALARFVLFALQTHDVRRQIALLTNTSSQGNIGMSDIGRIAVPQPSVPEQIKIAAVLSDMEAEITALEARREKTRAIMRGMMQLLLTGRVRLVRAARAEASA
jgi:type I restriction enzyme, S subunit